MDQLHDIRVFIEVATAGSFMRAGNAIGQTSSAVSKAIRRLEDDLQVRLLLRTTRQVYLTEEGRTYLKECERILNDLTFASEAVASGKAKAQGQLRVEFPLLWGRKEVVPALPKFVERYPKIELRLIFSEHQLDMIRDNLDLCVRVGMQNQPELVAKPLVPTRAIVVAAPSYLQRAGTPKSPDDLQRHDCLQFLDARLNPVPWHFKRGAKAIKRTFKSRFMFNYPAAMRDAALAGLGLVQGPDLLFEDALKRGRLVQVLDAWATAGPSICIAWPQNRYLSQRARVFIDWLCELVK